MTTARKDPATLKRKQPNLPPTVKMKRGRPVVYNTDIDESVRRLCLLGLSDAEIAEFLGINPTTMCKWDNAHPSFFNARIEGRTKADAEVADALRRSAIGYDRPAEKVFLTKDGEIVRASYIEHYPPNGSNAALWLANRQRGRWKLKPTEDDARDEDGGRSIRIYGGLPDD
jgi:hypothetical protein